MALGLGGVAAALAAGVGMAFQIVPDRVARAKNPVLRRPPYPASDDAQALHGRLTVVDLHADSLLWGRDLLRRASHSHVDVPRLIEGGIAVQGLAVCTQVPRRVNLERNDDRTDDVTLLALAQRWPWATWRSRLARASYQADRAHAMATRSGGRLAILTSVNALDGYLARRARDHAIAAGFLAIEGAHALDGDPANVEVLAEAGYRMMSPTHFFDNAFGGSAHGIEQGGLTARGREMVARMQARGMIVDVAHASVRTIDDVLDAATRPVIASHTGVRGVADNVRNLSDTHLRAIAGTGGLIGIGFWPTASGGEDARAIARSIRYAVAIAGIDHVGLGSDFDGAVPVPFDATGIVQVTEALLAEGFDEPAIAAVMGGNAVRLLRTVLPAG